MPAKPTTPSRRAQARRLLPLLRRAVLLRAELADVERQIESRTGSTMTEAIAALAAAVDVPTAREVARSVRLRDAEELVERGP